MIRAAFDASMDSPHGVTAIAGYIGDAKEWRQVQEDWEARLVLCGLRKFRLTEVLNRFGREGGLKCAHQFAEIIEGSQLHCVTAHMLDTGWARLDKDSEYLKVYPRRQHACLDLLLTALSQEARLEFKAETISVVFDSDYDGTKRAAAVYDAWLARTGHPGFGQVAWTKSEMAWDVVPLQCADLAAGLLRQDPFSKEMLKPSKDRDYRATFSPLADLAKKVMRRSRGAMWSIDLANETEEFLRKFRSSA